MKPVQLDFIFVNMVNHIANSGKYSEYCNTGIYILVRNHFAESAVWKDAPPPPPPR